MADGTQTIRNTALFLCLLPLAATAQVVQDRPDLPALDNPGYLPPAARADENFELPPVPAEPATRVQSGAAVPVSRVVFSGNNAIDDEELLAVASPYMGQTMDAAAMELLRQALTRYYIDKGYINSGALFGEPAYSDETLRFNIVEGRLTEIRTRGTGRLNENYLAARMMVDEDAAFNMQEFRERFQLFLDDPLFDKLNARLLPGSAPGEAILDLEVDRARAYQLTAFSHNSRSPSIGSEVLGLSGWVRNLTGRGDVLRISAESADDDNSINSQSISWRLPLSFSGLDLNMSWEKGDSMLVEEPLDVLDIESELETRQVGLAYTITENLAQRIRVGVDYVEKENSTLLLGEPFSFVPNEPTGETETDSIRFWQEYSHRTVSQVIAVRSTFVQTDTNLEDPPPQLDPDAFRVQDPDYAYWLGQVHYARQIGERGMQLVVRGTVQISDDRLLSLDGLSIGGNSSVRGFRENQLIRDAGYVINTEFVYPMWQAGSGRGALTLVPFIDYGRGKNKGRSNDDLTSAGVALRYRLGGLSVDLTFAEQINPPDEIDDLSGDLQDDGIHFRVSYDLF